MDEAKKNFVDGQQNPVEKYRNHRHRYHQHQDDQLPAAADVHSADQYRGLHTTRFLTNHSTMICLRTTKTSLTKMF